MRSRANWEPLFLPPDLSRFTCKTTMKRRGWDSNPRDDLTPPTRFPIALLRPTRTPLRRRRTGVYQKQIYCYMRRNEKDALDGVLALPRFGGALLLYGACRGGATLRRARRRKGSNRLLR